MELTTSEERDRPEAGTRAPTDPVDLLRAAYPGLLATAVRLTGSKQEAEDLVQDALIETLSRHPEFEGIERPLGYMRTVLYRRAFSHWRLRSREVPLDVRAVLLEDSMAEIDERLAIEDALARIAPRQRACLVLRLFYGLGDAEIAAILGCRASTVRSQLARGQSRLRERLEVDDED